MIAAQITLYICTELVIQTCCCCYPDPIKSWCEEEKVRCTPSRLSNKNLHPHFATNAIWKRWKQNLPGKLGQQSAICLNSLGLFRDYGLNYIFVFNSFSSFRQFLFPFFQNVVWLSEILWGFTKFFFKQMLKISAFYLEKQNSFIPKKYNLGRSLYIGQESSNRWCFAVPNFSEGFGFQDLVVVLKLLTLAIQKGSKSVPAFFHCFQASWWRLHQSYGELRNSIRMFFC